MKAMSLAAFAATNMNDLIAATTPGGIEKQEAAGQVDFVRNATLPKDCDRSMLALAGITFGADADDLFVNVQLPDGWKKQATSHSMWSDLLDDKGRKRASIFYKAAFYDRNAHMSMNRRYNIESYEPCNADGVVVEYGTHTHMQTSISDCGNTHVVIALREDQDYDAQKAHEALATKWLDEHFPDWRNPLAYW